MRKLIISRGVNFSQEGLLTFPISPFQPIPLTLQPGWFRDILPGQREHLLQMPFLGQLQAWWLQVAWGSLLHQRTLPFHKYSECLLCTQKVLCQASLPFTHPKTHKHSKGFPEVSPSLDYIVVREKGEKGT